MDDKCYVMVTDGTRFGSFNPTHCKGKPFIEHNGRTYCKRHDPIKREEKYQEKLRKDHEDDCKQCGHHFYGHLEKNCYKYCPLCGTKR